ncbi:MAG: 5-(carboxyamino)imidazole ribonucleotide mutase [Chloroflexi bacterium]|nr:5-(carboxyamino)imidazole ribonucleotide mutase [Chloroflexota bacterium]
MTQPAVPLVGIIMGSDSDLPVMKAAADICGRFGVPWEMRVMSAHRTPDDAAEYARTAYQRGLRVLIAGAGAAAHLAGALAANSPLPVIGVPVNATPLNGMDALLATVQMPSGIPVATVAVGGGTNAGLLAVQMLATGRPDLIEKLLAYKADLASAARAKNANMPRME